MRAIGDRKNRILWFCYFAFILFFCNSCKKDKQGEPVPTPTSPVTPKCVSKYSRDVRPIVLSKCAISGCHVANFPFGDFTTYAILKSKIDNGRVDKLVYENDLMPPANSVKLSDAEKETLKCWIDDGAPEN